MTLQRKADKVQAINERKEGKIVLEIKAMMRERQAG